MVFGILAGPDRAGWLFTADQYQSGVAEMDG